ncbi:PDZ and LIM domain protein Zasp [Caenorhabditis elegans]|uniref:PDZ and LIM domain protein Zasp n=1 Tax=Caenorhabditis elegans TaxID=6239 RepID=G5EFG1_CAEEL|nr:PDZ and LIM domain protein Zasp [Caenorhabditis elegans]CAJ43909.1 PDZ and LIM domain protein Zasp [Caenorhabditis elegans]|eukprot:NP_001040987.1 ALP/Enigma encoding [Caenorhabditis elegans]
MERVTVRMARSDRRTPWGFGVTEAPDGAVLIVNVIGGSLADRAGLRNGDVVDRLEDLDNLDINAVDRLLVTAHEKIELIVTRQPSGAATRIWRPEVTENTGPGQDQTPYRVNLQHSSDTRPPQGFNNSALPFETDQRVKHMQYNSPLGIYSDKSAAEQYVQQTQGLGDNSGARAAAQRQDEPAYLRSETLRLLKEQEHGSAGGAGTTLSNHPNPSGLPVCFMCTRPILGVMARAAGKNLHGDCLSCATCGNSLRNVGHHFIEDKFYCDIHGTQRKHGGRPGMDPNIFVKSSPTAAQPVHIQDSPRAAYHPQVNTARPVSVSPAPSAGSKTVTTHYHTPKTQGILSPGQRGVPTAAFGADLSKSVTYGGGVGPGGTHYDSNRLSPAPSQYSTQSRNQSQQHYQQHVVQAPPPVPSNPPPSNDTTAEDSRNFLASRLGQVMIDENKKAGGSNGSSQHHNQQGSSYTKTSFERTTTETRPQQNTGAPRAGDFRGTGHLTTTTTTQQNGGRAPFCESCKQQIRGAFVLATGKSWCPEHFVCANSSCRRRLLECGFVEEDGQKFCESCFEQHIAPRCNKCSKPIISDCLNALQKKWHPTCFTCAHCQKPFGNSAFYLEQGLPYCEQDWNALFTTKCVSCRYPIEAGDRWVEALGNAFHSNCFTCARCNHNLEGESFFAKNGQPFCRLHA